MVAQMCESKQLNPSSQNFYQCLVHSVPLWLYMVMGKVFSIFVAYKGKSQQHDNS